MKSPRRILAIKNKHLGDIICSQPAFWALHRAFPEAELDVLVTHGTRSLVEGFPWVHRVIEAPRKQNSLSRVGAELKVAWEIATAGYDLFVDFTWSDRAMTYAALSRARDRWAIQVTAGSALKPHIYNGHGGKPDKSWHVIEHERNFLVKMGLPHYEPEFFFPETKPEDAKVLAWLAEEKIDRSRLIVVHPTSRWLFKCWNDDKVAGLIDWLKNEGWQPVVTCGPSDEEMARARVILALTKSQPVVRIGDMSLRELAALMRQARFMFGMDSAPAHLAAAAGCRTVVLFGPSQINRWRPYGKNHVVIAGNCPCLVNRDPACDKSAVVKCLNAITLEQVKAAITTEFRLA